jgi:hypothetical protein
MTSYEAVVSLLQGILSLDNIASFLFGVIVSAVGILFSGVLSRLPSKYLHSRFTRSQDKEDAVTEWVRNVREETDTAIDVLDTWGEKEIDEIPQSVHNQCETLQDLKGRTTHPDAEPPEVIDTELRDAVQEFGELEIATDTEEARIVLISKLIGLRQAAKDYQND